MPAKVRVLIVDDSNLVRAVLRAGLTAHPQIEVVGEARDGVEALQKIRALRPDVVTLDVEMPRLNGIGVLERVAGRAPVSFVMVSTLTQAGARITFEALHKGAFDYIPKPKRGFAGVPEFRRQLHEKVLAAARSRGRTYRAAVPAAPTAAPTLPPSQARGWVVAIGISCGGPPTLLEMMPAFPSDFPPILITQHMPPEFTGSFAKHLDEACALIVHEARDGQRIEAGHVYVAPGSHHLRLTRQGVNLFLRLDDGPKVSGHRPSVDVMFESVARACGPRAVGVIMTGMGEDGARGIVALHNAGAWTIAQDESTSLVYGMPKAAAATGCVDYILPLGKIPVAVARLMAKGQKRQPAPA